MSFRIAIDPKDRKAALFINHVREEIVRAFTQRRDKDGITQADVAEKLGLGKKNRAVISRVFSGEHNLTLRSLSHLAWALGQDIEIRLVPECQKRSSGPSIFSTEILASESEQNETIEYVEVAPEDNATSAEKFRNVLEPA